MFVWEISANAASEALGFVSAVATGLLASVFTGFCAVSTTAVEGPQGKIARIINSVLLF